MPLSSDGVPRGQLVVDRLVALLDLERIEEDIFRGVSPPESPVRVFGGQVAGQALVAAGRTVPVERAVHSLVLVDGAPPAEPGRWAEALVGPLQERGRPVLRASAEDVPRRCAWSMAALMPTRSTPTASTPARSAGSCWARWAQAGRAGCCPGGGM